MSAVNTLQHWVQKAVRIVRSVLKLIGRSATSPGSQSKPDQREVILSSDAKTPQTDQIDFDAQEIRDLDMTRSMPLNRKQRRKIAKRAGVRFKVVNPGMARKPPTYLGIREFKKSTRDKKTVQMYKNNAHLSKQELDVRRAKERLGHE